MRQNNMASDGGVTAVTKTNLFTADMILIKK